MSPNTRARFLKGDNVYVELVNHHGTPGYHEAIVLEQSNDEYTVAAHVRGRDERAKWAVVPHVPRESLGPELRNPVPEAYDVKRGAACWYATEDFWGRRLVVDAVVLDHKRLVHISTGEKMFVFAIAYRSPCAAGWEVAEGVDAAYVRVC
ncbi:hypothetical protein AURDEDRAFT_124065 [Auricularia subglabra TFB-10046 SS5]|nr:hypothetical protein AURDEDRAFT_124065 [Auricularia subglabra TFB-10046 SS5]